MDDPIKIIILVLLLLVVIIVTITIISKQLNKKVQNVMFESVYNVLKQVQNTIPGDSRIVRCYTRTHDFYFESPNHRYFIKIVYNPGNHEICVNNALKWQVRKSLGDDRMYFVEGIEPLMRIGSSYIMEKPLSSSAIFFISTHSPSTKSLGITILFTSWLLTSDEIISVVSILSVTGTLAAILYLATLPITFLLLKLYNKIYFQIKGG